MCSSQTILNNYTSHLRNGVLFKQGFRREPITIDSFINMFNATKNLENEANFIFVEPERFRYHYMVEHIHSNRTQFY